MDYINICSSCKHADTTYKDAPCESCYSAFKWEPREEKLSNDLHVPPHYSGKMDIIEFCFLNNIPFAEGNVIKYVYRWRNKGGIEDLKKAKDYIERIIKNEEKMKHE